MIGVFVVTGKKLTKKYKDINNFKLMDIEREGCGSRTVVGGGLAVKTKRISRRARAKGTPINARGPAVRSRGGGQEGMLRADRPVGGRPLGCGEGRCFAATL